MVKTLTISELQRKLTKSLMKFDGVDYVDGSDFDNNQIEVALSTKSEKQRIVIISIQEEGLQ